MSDLISAIHDDMSEYVRLCQAFGQDIKYDSNGNPDCYSVHARKLERRAEREESKKKGKDVPLETEVKLRVNEDVICRLEKELGAPWEETHWLRQENIIYRTTEGFVRVRRESGEVTLTIKGKRLLGEYNERPEVECKLPKNFFDAVVKSNSGALVYEKKRASFDHYGCTVCLDNLYGQYFVEIEGAKELIEKNIASLRLDDFPRIKIDYAQIVQGMRKKDDKKNTN